MIDQKPKHKPQQKRTLEEVLKSLQDLIRSDLVSAAPLHESGHIEPGRHAAAGEPDAFHDALLKLDQIINEKIIEPTERAQRTPPGSSLPDEGTEIEWTDAVESDRAVDKDESEIESADMAALQSVTSSLDEEIELQPMESDAAPSNQPAPVSVATTASSQEAHETNTNVASTQVAAEPEVEVLEATSVERVEELVAESADIDASVSTKTPPKATVVLQAQEPTESEEDQQTFGFATPTPASADTPGAEHRLEPTRSPTGQPDVTRKPEIPATEIGEHARAHGPAGAASVDASAADDYARKSKVPMERAEATAVESNSGGDTGAFTVEFTAEPKAPSQTDAAAHETETAWSTTDAKPGTNDTKRSPEETAVKKKPPPSDPTTDADKKSSERETHRAATLTVEEGIPVLKDIADLQAPPSSPLPGRSQARDIAIRVIAKLNIERRKTGEAPLDIKTIERLQQYLADALSKRTLNNSKQ